MNNLINGTYPYFSLIALMVIIYRLKKGSWQREESILLALYIIGYLSLIFQIVVADNVWYVSSRYLLPLLPLFLGFTALGVRNFWQNYPRKWLIYVAILLSLFFYIDSLMPTLKDFTSVHRREINCEINTMAKIIKEYPVLERKAPAIWWYEPRFKGRYTIKNGPYQLNYLTKSVLWNSYFPNESFDFVVTKAFEDSLPDSLKIYTGKIYSLYKRSNL